MPRQSCGFLHRLPEITSKHCVEKEKDSTRYGLTISGESVLCGGTAIVATWRLSIITKEESWIWAKQQN